MKDCWAVVKTADGGHQYLDRSIHFDFTLKFQFLSFMTLG